METRDIRLANLLKLSGGYKKISTFCERIEMNPAYFSQLKSGKKAIGDDLARRIERTLGLPRGYLDTPKSTAKNDSAIPVETLGLAYAIESLDANVRDCLSRLIYSLAADAAKNKQENRTEQVVMPFSIEIKGESNGECGAVPPEQKRIAGRG